MNKQAFPLSLNGTSSIACAVRCSQLLNLYNLKPDTLLHTSQQSNAADVALTHDDSITHSIVFVVAVSCRVDTELFTFTRTLNLGQRVACYWVVRSSTTFTRFVDMDIHASFPVVPDNNFSP